MIMKKIIALVFAALLLCGCGHDKPLKSTGHYPLPGKIPVPATSFKPEHYICYRTSSEIIIDGQITDSEWSQAPWSNPFTDIEGDLKPKPLHDTRIRMLWDDNYLYVAAELVEPHIWATLRQRDTIIYYDNDFEVFIDPDGDTHGYYEFEMNAYNTVWDLLLTTPYRDFGKVIDAWDIQGLRSAVKIFGTINDPSDIDEKWTIELAFPFDVLKEWGDVPADGTQWRVNFSRVNWKTKHVKGKYVKETDPATGKSLPEFNWLWSPQGLINVHYPEMWGFLQFSTGDGSGEPAEFVMNPDEKIKWELRKLYYAQRAYAAEKNHYADDAAILLEYGYKAKGESPEIIITMSGYEASLPSADKNGYVCIDSQGRTWTIDLSTDK
jgi:hypothetical protein